VALYQKVDGVWVLAQRPYLKRNGVFVASNAAYVKRSGAWVQAYEFDVTPPNPPEITLSVVEDFDTVKGEQVLQTRYIRVGTRLPGSSNDSDARLTRVLTNYAGNPPSTQFGGTYTSTPDHDWPGEPWSEWRYNSYGNHNDTSNYTYKQWPPNVTSGFTVTGDKEYFFTGWSLDENGNWSSSTPASIKIPKDSVKTDNIIVKEARFQPNSSGTWRSDGFHGGDLIAQQSPRCIGVWFHGNQFTDSIGKQGAPTIRNAQIRITREGADEDNGSANANIYLFWHPYVSQASLPNPTDPGGLTANEVTKLGQLTKGETKWFALPDSFNNNLNTAIKGMGLFWKDPARAAGSSAFPADYSRIVGTSQALRCGEVHIVWEEKL
jgi:hypothetical protein